MDTPAERPQSPLFRDVARLFAEGKSFLALRQLTLAIDVFDRLIERFGNIDNHDISELVIWARLNRASTLLDLARVSDAQVEYNRAYETLHAIEDTEGPSSSSYTKVHREQIIRVLVGRAIGLWRLSQPDQALRAAGEALNMMQDDLELRPLSAAANNIRGPVSVCQTL